MIILRKKTRRQINKHSSGDKILKAISNDLGYELIIDKTKTYKLIKK